MEYGLCGASSSFSIHSVLRDERSKGRSSGSEGNMGSSGDESTSFRLSWADGSWSPTLKAQFDSVSPENGWGGLESSRASVNESISTENKLKTNRMMKQGIFIAMVPMLVMRI
jgi:hypothetical protein